MSRSVSLSTFPDASKSEHLLGDVGWQAEILREERRPGRAAFGLQLAEDGHERGGTDGTRRQQQSTADDESGDAVNAQL